MNGKRVLGVNDMVQRLPISKSNILAGYTCPYSQTNNSNTINDVLVGGLVGRKTYNDVVVVLKPCDNLFGNTFYTSDEGGVVFADV